MWDLLSQNKTVARISFALSALALFIFFGGLKEQIGEQNTELVAGIVVTVPLIVGLSWAIRQIFGKKKVGNS